MNKIKVLMIDDNVKLIEAVKEFFKKKNIEVVKEAYDGYEGFEIIKENKIEYDIILLDLIMPKKDGLYVLEEMEKLGIKKNIIVETSYNATEVVKQVSDYGVDYFILKPFDLEDLEKRIISICNRDKKEKSIDFFSSNIHSEISDLLHNLGIPSHIKGYQFIRDAVFMMFENPDLIGGITKELYPELAKRFDTTVSRVERAIRHAIEVSWNRGDINLMEKIFGHSVDIDKAKPTNSEFIVTLADKLRLDFHKVGV